MLEPAATEGWCCEKDGMGLNAGQTRPEHDAGIAFRLLALQGVGQRHGRRGLESHRSLNRCHCDWVEATSAAAQSKLELEQTALYEQTASCEEL